MAKVGYLKLITGPMGAGKSTMLVNDLTVFAGIQTDKFNVVYINHTLDTRGETASFHSGKRLFHDKISCLKVTNLASIDVSAYDVIGVDEAQFYSDLLTVKLWVDCGKRVIVAGLKATYLRQPFGEIHRLLPECDEIVDLKAMCKRCLEEGRIVSSSFNGYVGQLEEIKSGTKVGGIDLYPPLCRGCHDDFLHSIK